MMCAFLPLHRHAERVSASISRPAQVGLGARWSLKRVQGDGGE